MGLTANTAPRAPPIALTANTATRATPIGLAANTATRATPIALKANTATRDALFRYRSIRATTPYFACAQYGLCPTPNPLPKEGAARARRAQF